MRLFVSIDVPGHIRKNLEPVCRELAKQGLACQQELHCTLCFIGEKTEAQAKILTNVLASVKAAPFSVEVTGIGAFPGAKHPSIVWVGLHSAELNGLATRIASTLAIAEKRPFKAHATLTRVKTPVDLSLLDKYASTNFGSFTVEAFELKQSDLLASGARHITLSVFKMM